MIAEHGLTLITGAGKLGLMNTIENAALEAGGKVTGVIPSFMVREGWHHEGLTELIETPSMHERKQTMANLSDGIIALPGGCGTMEELLRLPGVGRKTANVILSVVWDKSAMAVDTHVFRVSHRIGLVPKRCTTPYSVEMELMKYLPHDIIPKAHHWLILHGRYMCTARAPKCSACGLTEVCKEYNKREK